MLQVLNAIVRQYMRLPAGAMFMNKLRIQLVRTARRHFRAFNDLMKLVQNVELACMTEDCLLVIKLHCDITVDNSDELLQARDRVILVHDDGSTSSNCLHYTSKLKPIRSVVLPTSKQEDFETLDGYLSMLQVFCQHLNIQVLAYEHSNIETFSPSLCMFDHLEQLEHEEMPTYIRSLGSAANVASFKEISNKLNGRELAFSHGNFCYIIVDPEIQQPSVWLYRNRLPWLEFDSDLTRCQSIATHMKYLRVMPARVEGRLKTKYELEQNPFSFVAIVNVTSANTKQLLAELETCFREIFKELQMMGWKSTREEHLTVKVECLQDLCDMLGLPPHGLLKTLLTKK